MIKFSNKKIFFGIMLLGLFNPSMAQNRTSCNAVQEFLYPDSAKCPEMSCSSNYACYVQEDVCGAYACKTNGGPSGTECPEGTTYKPFMPDSTYNPDGNTGNHGTTGEGGYMCCPNHLAQCQQETFECFFDPENDYKLSVNVQVPDIIKQEQHIKWDFRDITLISKDRYDDRDTSHRYVDVFKSMNAVENGECVGDKDGNGNVVFTNVVNGAPCNFTIEYEEDEQGVLWYTYSFVVGYDDLYDVQPNGVVGIKRYGQNWNMNCRIKASDTLYVYPGAEGERDQKEVPADLKVDFDLEMFSKPDFLPENKFEDGDLVDIGVHSGEKQTIWVQARANINSGDGSNYMLHIKSCEVEQNQTTNGVDTPLLPYDFIVDGWRAPDYPGQSWIERTFALKDTRQQWSEDNNDKTVIVDQFAVDLWDPNDGTPGVDEQSYRFKCELVVCQISGFQRPTEDLHPNTVCKLNTLAPTRYNNLFNNGQYRNSRKEEYGRTEVDVAKSGQLNVKFQKDGEAPTTTAPTETTSGAAYSGLALCLILIISLL